MDLQSKTSDVTSPPGMPSVTAADRENLPPELVRLQNRQRQRLYVRLLSVAGDIFAITISFLLANVIRFGDPLHSQGLNVLVVLLPIYLPSALSNRAYGIGNLTNSRLGTLKALGAFLFTVGAIALVVFFLKVSTDFSRLVFGTGTMVALAAIPMLRFLLARVVRDSLNLLKMNEIIIEDGAKVMPLPGAVLLDAASERLAPRLDDPAMLDRLGRYLRNADRVIIACPPERRWAWAVALKGADVHAEVFAPEVEALGPLGIDRYNGHHTLVIATGPLAFADQFMKRAFDIGLVLLAAPFVLPVMALVAVALRLDSQGPIIFAQERVGLGNRIFHMYKFRSMYVNRLDQDGGQSTSRDDDRVTRVGRFIRANSLDELPQLFNVLRGDMSIVGPRPHALGSKAEEKLFWDIDTTYWHRHAVKPGLTGLAQIRGYRGATEKVSDLSNRLQADLEYLSGWSIWRDVSIIFATFRVLIHRNAY